MFKKGDRVYVDDPALEHLRIIMRRTGNLGGNVGHTKAARILNDHPGLDRRN